MKKKLLVLFAITVCSTSQSVFGQDPESKDDKLNELIERQRTIRVSISAGGGSNFGPVKESFKVGEPITIVVFMTNTGNETVGVEISDP